MKYCIVDKFGLCVNGFVSDSGCRCFERLQQSTSFVHTLPVKKISIFFPNYMPTHFKKNSLNFLFCKKSTSFMAKVYFKIKTRAENERGCDCGGPVKVIVGSVVFALSAYITLKLVLNKSLEVKALFGIVKCLLCGLCACGVKRVINIFDFIVTIMCCLLLMLLFSPVAAIQCDAEREKERETAGAQ